MSTANGLGDILTGIGLVLFAVFGWFVVHWFVPAYRVATADASLVEQAAWVEADGLLEEPPKGIPWVILTQVSSTFRHNGVHKKFWIGLRNGAGYHCTEDCPLRVYALTDPINFLRRTPRNIPEDIPTEDEVYRLVSALGYLANGWGEWIPTDRLRSANENTIYSENFRSVLDAARFSGFVREDRLRSQVCVSASGFIWFADWSRKNGLEVIPDAQEKAMFPWSFTNNGVIQGDNSQNAEVNNSGIARDVNLSIDGDFANDLDALKELLKIVKESDLRDGLTEEDCARIDDEIPVIEEAVELGRPDLHSVRKALNGILSVSGQLILGAGGSALFAALQALAA